jgi:hypothetical protein
MRFMVPFYTAFSAGGFERSRYFASLLRRRSVANAVTP